MYNVSKKSLNVSTMSYKYKFPKGFNTMWHVVLIAVSTYSMTAAVPDYRTSGITFSVADFIIISVFKQSRATSQIPVFITKFTP